MILLQHFLWILEGGGNLYGPVNMSYYLLSNKLTAFFCICTLDSYLKQNSSSWPLFPRSWSCTTSPPVALYRLHFVFLSITAWGHHRRVSIWIQVSPCSCCFSYTRGMDAIPHLLVVSGPYRVCILEAKRGESNWTVGKQWKRGINWWWF